MKVTVKKRQDAVPVRIYTQYIKLEAALKLSNAVYSGGEAKALIQQGEVRVNGEICTMRGKKLYPGDTFCFMGTDHVIILQSI